MAEEQAVTTISQLSSSTDLGGRSDWGNKLVVNTGTNPVINFAFMLRVEGAFDLPCKAVKGIRRENEFDYIQEGGLNDYVHLKRKAISKPFTFQVERYVGVNWVDPMPLGTELLLPLILFVNNRTFPTLKPVRNYVFTGCTVIAKDYGELNAEVSGLLVETVTIAYREMVCLDIPNDTLSSDDVWAFDEKKKQGKGKRHFNSNFFNTEWEAAPYSSKEKMEERAKKYNFKEKKNGSVTHNPTENEHTKATMEGNARLWPTEDKEGNIPTYGKDYSKYVTDYNKKLEEEIENAETPEEKEKANEKKKIVMIGAAAKRYEHTKTPDLTTGSATRNPTVNEHSKTQMEQNAKQWPTAKDETMKIVTYGKDYSKYVTDYNTKLEEEIKNAKTPEEKEKANEKKQIVISGAAAKLYKHTKTPDLTTGSATRNPTANEYSKETMKGNAKQYKHTETPDLTTGSAKHKPTANENTKETMEGNAKLWPTKDKEGNISTYGKDYSKYVTDYNMQLEEAANNATDPKEKAEAEGKKIAMGSAVTRQYTHSATPDMSKSSAKHDPKAKEHSKAQMETNAKKYEHSATPDMSKSSAKHDPKEIEHSKEAMETNAKKYDFKNKVNVSAKRDPQEIEHSKEAMETNAKKYDFKNKENGSAKRDPQEIEHSKAEMETNAKKYDIMTEQNGSAKHNSNEKEPSLQEMEAAKQLWPEHSSARREEMTTPVPRLWPTTRSAKQITDFLKKQ